MGKSYSFNKEEEVTTNLKTKIIGQRTNCITEQITNVPLIAKIEEREGSRSFWLEGGPTGFESICLPIASEWRPTKQGWSACAGTTGRWDKLWISPSQMKKAFDDLRLDEEGNPK